MKFLWLSWKDISHPLAGGAEVVLHELSKRLVAEGHQVTVLTARYKGSSKHDVIDGVSVIRIGSNRYLHPFSALWYYVRHLRNTFDVVIETVNTAPYFAVLAPDSAKQVLFYHQLAREIWYHESPFPVSVIGYYVLEPLATFALGKSNTPVITVSESTKKDLQHFGFKPENIHIASEGLTTRPAETLQGVTLYDQPTLLSFGAMREMKRTLDQVKAFEIAKQSIPELRMKIAGSHNSDYGRKVLDYISHSRYKADIEVLGRVSDEEREVLMQRSHVIAVTSIKEGWGLIVTEANSQGTPAVVYDVDGLRDSVKADETGIVTDRDPAALAAGIVRLFQDEATYNKMRRQAHNWSKQITFEQSLKDVKQILEIA